MNYISYKAPVIMVAVHAYIPGRRQKKFEEFSKDLGRTQNYLPGKMLQKHRMSQNFCPLSCNELLPKQVLQKEA